MQPIPIPPTSRAMVMRQFGGPEVLELREVATSRPKRADEMLVKVRATSINPIEWKMREGHGLPKWAWSRALGPDAILGIDFSGTVEVAGDTGYRVGQRVMGALPLHGAYADYLVVRPSDSRTGVATMPAGVSFEDAALVPFAGLVAFAGLISHGGLPLHKPDARILIIGASGGVGHLAVQIAKHVLGASLVVAVCSSRNAAFARQCGADYVLPHDQEPIDQIAARHPHWAGSFDLIFDAVGIDAYFTKVAPFLLRRGGRFVTAALPQHDDGRPGEDVTPSEGLALIAKLAARQLGGRYRLIAGLLGDLPSHRAMPLLAQWLGEGKLRPHRSACFDLSDIAAAHRSSQTGRTVGKIGITVSTPPTVTALPNYTAERTIQ